MTGAVQYIDYALIVLCAAVGMLAALKFVHILQLEGYQSDMYFKWLKAHAWHDWLPTVLVFLICVLIEAALPFAHEFLNESITSVAQLLVRLIYILLMAYIGHTWRKAEVKRPLVFTNRIKRLLLALALVVVLLNIYPFFEKNVYGVAANTYALIKIFTRITPYLVALLLPLTVALAHYIALPVEKFIIRRFFLEAKHKLEDRPDMLKIGVTGSYGKTSVKFALGAVLKQKFQTYVTPNSCNTPMGVTRVVREALPPSTEIFVSEMGARRVGEIEEMCDLVGPKIGVLTPIGKQHLETFGSQERICNTKFELIAALPADGAAFFDADNAHCLELSKRSVTVKNKLLYGIESKEQLYMRATNIAAGPGGSVFTLVAEDGAVAQCQTRLLGRHNIINLAAAAAVGYYLGLTMEQIARGIKELEPVDHRLKIISGDNGVTVIDDAFNSNPEGSKMAMEVLRSFEGRKIVITPGMVELGAEEELLNEDFGEEIACSVDFAILLGKKRSEPILRGMRRLSFPEERVFVAGTFEEANAILSNLTMVGDVVLFENDLTDNYNE